MGEKFLWLLVFWPCWFEPKKLFYNTIYCEWMLAFITFLYYFIMSNMCDSWDDVKLSAYCVTRRGGYYSDPALYFGGWVVIWLAYVLWRQAKEAKDLDSLRWRVDLWFIVRSIYWIAVFANFFCHGVSYGTYSSAFPSFCLIIASFLPCFWVFNGLQAHRAAGVLLDNGDWKQKNPNIAVVLRDNDTGEENQVYPRQAPPPDVSGINQKNDNEEPFIRAEVD